MAVGTCPWEAAVEVPTAPTYQTRDHNGISPSNLLVWLLLLDPPLYPSKLRDTHPRQNCSHFTDEKDEVQEKVSDAR